MSFEASRFSRGEVDCIASSPTALPSSPKSKRAKCRCTWLPRNFSVGARANAERNFQRLARRGVSGCVTSAGQALWGLTCLRALPETPRRCHHFGNLFRHSLNQSREVTPFWVAYSFLPSCAAAVRSLPKPRLEASMLRLRLEQLSGLFLPTILRPTPKNRPDYYGPRI